MKEDIKIFIRFHFFFAKLFPDEFVDLICILQLERESKNQMNKKKLVRKSLIRIKMVGSLQKEYVIYTVLFR